MSLSMPAESAKSADPATTEHAVRQRRFALPQALRSLRAGLFLWLGAGMTAAILMAGSALYFQSRAQADELFDYQMRQIVDSLPRQAFSPIPLSLLPDQYRPELDDSIILQIWDQTGVVIYQSHANMQMPEQIELGFANVVHAGKVWRVYSAVLGSTIVEVAQPRSARSALAAKMAVRTVWPLLLVFPLMAILIWFGTRHALRPVSRVTAELLERDAKTLQPFYDHDLPDEIRPLTTALNNLLGRLDNAMQKQRIFIADAAHALRTPVTALRLQAQLVQRASGEGERSVALVDLTAGIDRVTRLLQQLLTLARQEPGSVDTPFTEVALDQLLQQSVADLVPFAASRQIDLGITHQVSVVMPGDPGKLVILLHNLLDNAIKYSQPGSEVDVSLDYDPSPVTPVSSEVSVPRVSTMACLTIQDHGGGIPEEDLERVFDRFYQPPTGVAAGARGSGLGLAIVREIADVHGMRVSLSNQHGGLRVQLLIPMLDFHNGRGAVCCFARSCMKLRMHGWSGFL